MLRWDWRIKGKKRIGRAGTDVKKKEWRVRRKLISSKRRVSTRKPATGGGVNPTDRKSRS